MRCDAFHGSVLSHPHSHGAILTKNYIILTQSQSFILQFTTSGVWYRHSGNYGIIEQNLNSTTIWEVGWMWTTKSCRVNLNQDRYKTEMYQASSPTTTTQILMRHPRPLRALLKCTSCGWWKLSRILITMFSTVRNCTHEPQMFRPVVTFPTESVVTFSLICIFDSIQIMHGFSVGDW
jgi:hypothetical protein